MIEYDRESLRLAEHIEYKVTTYTNDLDTMSCSQNDLYHIPQIPNLEQEILRTVQSLHWILW